MTQAPGAAVESATVVPAVAVVGVAASYYLVSVCNKLKQIHALVLTPNDLIAALSGENQAFAIF